MNNDLKDQLANRYKKAFESKTPWEIWGNYGRELRNCNLLAQKTRALAELFGAEPEQVGAALVTAFWRAINTEYHPSWTEVPFTATGMMSRWDKLVAKIRVREVQRDRIEEAVAEVRRRRIGSNEHKLFR